MRLTRLDLVTASIIFTVGVGFVSAATLLGPPAIAQRATTAASTPNAATAAPGNPSAGLPAGFTAVPLIGQPNAKGWTRQSLDVKVSPAGVEIVDNSNDYGSAEYVVEGLKKGALTVLVEFAKLSPNVDTVLLVRGNVGKGEEYNCTYDTKKQDTIAWGGKTPPTVKAEAIAGGVRLTCRFSVLNPDAKPLVRLFPAIGPDVRNQSAGSKGGLLVTRLALAKE